MALKLIGYWKAELMDRYPCPQETEADLASDLRDRVVRYLETGTTVSFSCGASWCRYGCSQFNGSTALSDGVWFWPEGLVHYVRDHRIGLPEEFLKDVASPVAQSSAMAESDDIDDSLWLAWGRAHRTPAFEASLRELAERSNLLAKEALDVAGERLAKKVGVLTDPCWTEGCAGNALRTNPLCGRCFAEAGGGIPESVEFKLLKTFLKEYRVKLPS